MHTASLDLQLASSDDGEAVMHATSLGLRPASLDAISSRRAKAVDAGTVLDRIDTGATLCRSLSGGRHWCVPEHDQDIALKAVDLALV